ncbi:MAG TPA: transglycosylase family protein [Acidimicrobiales bacterium]|jgi:hypothetical protein|nr:transglycosylase family protein [Acidimicrobiales bacterium]
MTLRLRQWVALAAMVVVLAACTPDQLALFNVVTEPYRDVLTDDQLAVLRDCEAHGNYEAVSASGRYRGAYQFSQSTWDLVADRHFPWLVSADPAATEPVWQDMMARALWSERGGAPWPHCGPRV